MDRLLRESLTRLTEEEIYLLLEDYPDELYQQMFKDIPREDWDKIVRTDPSTIRKPDGSAKKVGKYVKWMSGLYRKGPKRFMEDLYKYSEYLNVFNKYKDKLDPGVRDIQKFKELGDLYAAIEDILSEVRAGGRKLMSKAEVVKDIVEKESKVVWENDEWIVYVPETYEASCELGSGTEWCTASGNTRRWFDNYTEDGPLFIIINKENPKEKYQMHVESGSFMNAEDRSVEPPREIFDDLMEIASNELEGIHKLHGEEVKYGGETMKVEVDYDALEENSYPFSFIRSLRDYTRNPSADALYEIDEGWFGDDLAFIISFLGLGIDAVGGEGSIESNKDKAMEILSSPRARFILNTVEEVILYYLEDVAEAVRQADSYDGDVYGYMDDDFHIEEGVTFVNDYEDFFFKVFGRSDYSGSMRGQAITDICHRIENIVGKNAPSELYKKIVAALEVERKRVQPMLPFGESRITEAYQDVGFVGNKWGHKGSGILFTTGDKILLTLRSPYVEDPGVWGIPGGAVPEDPDTGEFMDDYDSARVEAEEELGIPIPVGEVIDKYVYREGNFTFSTFIVLINKELSGFRCNWENDDARWFSREDLSTVPVHYGVEEVLIHKDPFANEVVGEECRRIEEKSSSYYWVAFDIGHGKYMNEDIVSQLESGELKGLKGISDEPSTAVMWFGVARDSMLKMSQGAVMIENNILSIPYNDPDALVENNMQYLFRLFNSPPPPKGYQHVMRNVFEYMFLGLKQMVQGDKRLGNAVYNMEYAGIHHDMSYRFAKRPIQVDSIDDIVGWILEEIQDRLEEPKKEFDTMFYWEQIKPVTADEWWQAIRSGLRTIGEVYRSEGEISIKGDTFKVPEGSIFYHLYFYLTSPGQGPDYDKMFPLDREKAKEEYESIQMLKGRLGSKYKMVFISGRDLDKAKKIYFRRCEAKELKNAS